MDNKCCLCNQEIFDDISIIDGNEYHRDCMFAVLDEIVSDTDFGD